MSKQLSFLKKTVSNKVTQYRTQEKINETKYNGEIKLARICVDTELGCKVFHSIEFGIY